MATKLKTEYRAWEGTPRTFTDSRGQKVELLHEDIFRIRGYTLMIGTYGLQLSREGLAKVRKKSRLLNPEIGLKKRLYVAANAESLITKLTKALNAKYSKSSTRGIWVGVDAPGGRAGVFFNMYTIGYSIPKESIGTPVQDACNFALKVLIKLVQTRFKNSAQIGEFRSGEYVAANADYFGAVDRNGRRFKTIAGWMPLGKLD